MLNRSRMVWGRTGEKGLPGAALAEPSNETPGGNEGPSGRDMRVADGLTHGLVRPIFF